MLRQPGQSDTIRTGTHSRDKHPTLATGTPLPRHASHYHKRHPYRDGQALLGQATHDRNRYTISMTCTPPLPQAPRYRYRPPITETGSHYGHRQQAPPRRAASTSRGRHNKWVPLKSGGAGSRGGGRGSHPTSGGLAEPGPAPPPTRGRACGRRCGGRARTRRAGRGCGPGDRDPGANLSFLSTVLQMCAPPPTASIKNL